MNEVSKSAVSSKFQSPIYDVRRVPVWDLVAQSFNPNSLNSKSFSALQISIFNQGYAMCITTCENNLYDEEVASKLSPFERIKMHIEGSDKDAKSGSVTGDLAYATQISDSDMRRAFRMEIVDGAQRAGVIRMGTYLFMQKSEEQQIKMSQEWSEGKNVPEDAGKDMLMYLAWREQFSVPCSVLVGKSDAEKMSATVLFNTARGSHSLDSMKEIVSNLILVGGMSEDWVAKHLFLDLESVRRMTQLSGLKSAFTDIDQADYGWSPETDDSWERKTNGYLNREAAKFIQNFMREHPDYKEPNRDKDILDYAESLGWNKEQAMTLMQ